MNYTLLLLNVEATKEIRATAVSSPPLLIGSHLFSQITLAQIDTPVESLYAPGMVAIQRPDRHFPRITREVIQHAEGMTDIHPDGK